MAKNKIDVKAVLRRLGGPTKVHQLLVDRGREISKSAIEKWSARGRIPSDWLVELVTISNEIKRPLHLKRYIRQQEQATDREQAQV